MIIVAGIHGNEYQPVEILEKNKIPFVLGNPRAYQMKKRFVEQDLNGCFGTKNENYESVRARRLLKIIPKNERVIDFHTFSATSEPFVVIVDSPPVSPSARRGGRSEAGITLLGLAKTTGIKRVVYMKHNIKKGHALINYRNGISVELGHHDSKMIEKRLIKVLKSITKGKPHKINLYEVYGKIPASPKPKRGEKEKDDYINFKSNGEFIPILAGEKAYNFGGLKAREKRDIIKGRNEKETRKHSVIVDLVFS